MNYLVKADDMFPLVFGLMIFDSEVLRGVAEMVININTLRCNFAIYEIAGITNVCCNNIDRNAADASIDTECDRVDDLAAPTGNCTCAF